MMLRTEHSKSEVQSLVEVLHWASNMLCIWFSNYFGHREFKTPGGSQSSPTLYSCHWFIEFRCINIIVR